MLIRVLALLSLSTLSAAAPEPAGVACGERCGGDYACLVEQARCLVDAGEAREAVSHLKEACRVSPEDGDLVRLLAWSYLQLGNRVWAQRKLLARVDAAPHDAQARAWAVWVLAQDGSLAHAREVLDAAPVTENPADASRFVLLDLALAKLEEQPERVEAGLAAVRGGEALYPEDRGLLVRLREQVLGDRGEPVSIRLQASGGYASNVIESAPQDVGSGSAGERAPQAPVAGLDAVLRLEPWTCPRARPVGELRGKGFTPFTADTAGFGYLTGTGRVGLEWGPASGARARLLYAGELMGLRGDALDGAGGEGPTPVEGGWIMEAHRGDLELDLAPGVQLFAGGGRRIYRELRRTRTEFDGGGAWVLPLGGGWNLTTVATARVHRARHPGWHAWGLTGLVRLRVPLPGDHMIKLRGMATWDAWPGFWKWEPMVERRDDRALRLQAGPWTRDFEGWRIGLSYKLAARASSVDAYDYTDHRVLLELRWQRAWNPGLPRSVAVSEPWLPLPYGLEEGDDQGLDRVQDLLRQEDSARRGSSCAD